jgi:hypothetical protein
MRGAYSRRVLLLNPPWPLCFVPSAERRWAVDRWRRQESESGAWADGRWQMEVPEGTPETRVV